MPLPELPLELLLMIAHHIRDDDGELRYDDFNSFLQVNRALYACLNRMLWKEAAKQEYVTREVITNLIISNNLASLRFFLDLGANFEVYLPHFEITGLVEVGEEAESISTSLIIAADLDNVPLARLLLEKSAKVQYLDRNGNGKFSPLHAARSAEMVHLLLDHNADPNLEDGIVRQPLHWYAIRNDITAMRAILQRGAEVNPYTTLKTPLHESAKRNLAAVQLLVEYGADVKETDIRGYTPLHFAAQEGKIDVVRFLVERWPEGVSERTERDALLNTPLHFAAQEGQIDVVRFLVERWPEGVRERNDLLNTPLHLAAEAGEADVVKFLVERWPEGIRERDCFGNTPLHVTARSGEPGIVRLLVERWPEGKEALNNAGKTPLLMFEKNSWGINDKQKEEIIALLGGPYSEANDD